MPVGWQGNSGSNCFNIAQVIGDSLKKRNTAGIKHLKSKVTGFCFIFEEIFTIGTQAFYGISRL